MFGDIGGPLNWPDGVSFRIYLRDNDVGRPFTYTVNAVRFSFTNDPFVRIGGGSGGGGSIESVTDGTTTVANPTSLAFSLTGDDNSSIAVTDGGSGVANVAITINDDTSGGGAVTVTAVSYTHLTLPTTPYV